MAQEFCPFHKTTQWQKYSCLFYSLCCCVLYFMNGLSETRALSDIRRNIMLYCPSVMSDARDGLVSEKCVFKIAHCVHWPAVVFGTSLEDMVTRFIIISCAYYYTIFIILCIHAILKKQFHVWEKNLV